MHEYACFSFVFYRLFEIAVSRATLSRSASLSAYKCGEYACAIWLFHYFIDISWNETLSRCCFLILSFSFFCFVLFFWFIRYFIYFIYLFLCFPMLVSSHKSTRYDFLDSCLIVYISIATMYFAKPLATHSIYRWTQKINK